MKKLLTIILVLVMVIGSAVSASAIYMFANQKGQGGAAERELGEIVDGKLNIVIDGGTERKIAQAGDEVEVKIELINNVAISSVKLELSYSPKLSVATEINKKGQEVPKVVFDIYDPDDYSASRSSILQAERNRLILNWVSSEDEVRGDTTYATVTFKVADNARTGEFLPVIVDFIDEENIFDINQQNVDFVVINGGIDVVNENEEPDTDEETAGEQTEAETTEAETTEPEQGNEEDKLNIVIDGGDESIFAKPGDEVDVKIELKNNKTISSVKLTVTFDPKLSVATTTSKSGKVSPKVVFDIYDPDDTSVMRSATIDTENGGLLINWVSGESEVTGDTTYATITFKVSEDAEAGEFLAIEATANPNNIFDINRQNVPFTIVSGGIEIYQHQPDVLANDETNHWYTCKICDEKFDVAPHTYGEERIITPAKCTETGIAEHTCTVCGYTEQYEIAATGHTPGEIAYNPGGHFHKCTVCGQLIDLEDHEFEEKVLKDSTCIDVGTGERTCTVCGYTEKYRIKEKAHTPGKMDHDEKEHWYVCTGCGKQIDIHDHVYTADNKVCDVCGYVKEAGDCNGDGEKDNKDVVILFRHVSSKKTAGDNFIYDFNGDNSVDNKDVVALFRSVSTKK